MGCIALVRCVLVLRCGLAVVVWYPYVGWSSVRVAGYRLQPGHYSSLTAPNLQPTANQERNDQCGNQHYSRKLLLMGIVVPETY